MERLRQGVAARHYATAHAEQYTLYAMATVRRASGVAPAGASHKCAAGSTAQYLHVRRCP
jgi:hypothetical protein